MRHICHHGKTYLRKSVQGKKSLFCLMFAKLFPFLLRCLNWTRFEAEQYGEKSVGIKMSFLIVAKKRGGSKRYTGQDKTTKLTT